MEKTKQLEIQVERLKIENDTLKAMLEATQQLLINTAIKMTAEAWEQKQELFAVRRENDKLRATLERHPL